jgi:hypothetical protein
MVLQRLLVERRRPRLMRYYRDNSRKFPDPDLPYVQIRNQRVPIRLN